MIKPARDIRPPHGSTSPAKCPLPASAESEMPSRSRQAAALETSCAFPIFGTCGPRGPTHFSEKPMAVTRYYPWTQPNRLQDEIKHVFDRFFGDEETDQSNVVTSQWTPRVDVKEEDKRFVILADIPGVDPKDIEVSMDKGILTIRA